MPETDIGSAVASDLKSAFGPGTENYYQVSPESTEGPSEVGESRHTNRDWTQQLAYYKKIPELRAVIDARATWTVGKGYKAEEMTEINLMIIKGIGKESFNTILENMNRTADIGGDSFAEINRDEFGGVINIKVLDPSSIVVVADKQGIIVRYEQIKKPGFIRKILKMKPLVGKEIPVDKMFHFQRNRVADEILGISLVDSLIEIIKMRNEAMQDRRRVLHRNVDPLFIYHMDTDDDAEIAAFKAKQDKARGTGEAIYVPKGVIVPELVSVSGNAILDATTWIDNLNDYFYEVAGVPKFIVGNSKGFTDASEKIGYLAFQQTIEEKQLYNEEQTLNQLGLVIELEFPASLENELLSDKKKDVENGATKPSDTEAGAGE